MRNLIAAIIILSTGALLLSGCGSGSSSKGPDGNGTTMISVRSNPAGARIYLDGQETGQRTPADLPTIADTSLGTGHEVTLSLAGYNAWSGLAAVADGETFTLNANLTAATADKGTIDVQSQPAGARILLDGTDTGRVAPATLSNVPASQHVLELRQDGYYPFREEVVVASGRTATSAPTLTRYGNGRVTGRVVDPEGNGLVGAQVAVRGLDTVAQTTVYGIFVLPNVPVGTHALTATINAKGTTLVGTRDTVTVVDGRLTSNVDIVTSINGSAGTIYGRVTDDRGGPVEGAQLFASQAVAPNFVPDPTIAPHQGETDSQGEFQLGSLPSGFWVITAAYPGMATVTRGISPQLYVASGAEVRVDFDLPSADSARPGAPLQLSAVAFTLPSPASRAPGAYEAVRDRLLAATRAGRWGVKPSRAASATQTGKSRTASAGSLLEVDLSWVAPNTPDVIGYLIERSNQQNTGFSLLEDLLNPHAGLWLDYDQQLTPGRSFFYRMTAVNSGGINSDRSNVAEARPLDQMNAVSPVNSASASPTFTWVDLPGAFTYAVQVFDSFPERFTEPLWESERLFTPQTSVRYAGPDLQTGHTYYWVVAGGNSADLNSINGWSLSQIRSFTVQ